MSEAENNEDENEFDKINALLGLARSLPNGSAKVAVIQEAVRLADITQDVEAQYVTRFQLVEATMFAGEQDQGLVAFSWCMAKSIEMPNEYPVDQLLWAYKWIVNSLSYFPNFTLNQIDAIFKDMEKHYREFGSTMNAYYSKLHETSVTNGNRKQAQEYFELLVKTPRDDLSDCLACDMDHKVEYLIFLENDHEAIEAAEPLIKKKHSCSEVPHRTFPKLFLPLIRTGQAERAIELAVKSYRLISTNPEFINFIADHISLAALTGNWAHGIKLIEKHFPVALESRIPILRLQFLTGVLFFLEAHAERAVKKVLIRVPNELGVETVKGKAPDTEILSKVRKIAYELAARFDERNENHFYTEKFDSDKGLWKFAKEVPLPKATPKKTKRAEAEK